MLGAPQGAILEATLRSGDRTCSRSTKQIHLLAFEVGAFLLDTASTTRLTAQSDETKWPSIRRYCSIESIFVFLGLALAGGSGNGTAASASSGKSPKRYAASSRSAATGTAASLDPANAIDPERPPPQR